MSVVIFVVELVLVIVVYFDYLCFVVFGGDYVEIVVVVFLCFWFYIDFGWWLYVGEFGEYV